MSKPMAVDYEELLRKYIADVVYLEGVDYIQHAPGGEYSEAEWKALRRLAGYDVETEPAGAEAC